MVVIFGSWHRRKWTDANWESKSLGTDWKGSWKETDKKVKVEKRNKTVNEKLFELSSSWESEEKWYLGEVREGTVLLFASRLPVTTEDNAFFL